MRQQTLTDIGSRLALLVLVALLGGVYVAGSSTAVAATKEKEATQEESAPAADTEPGDEAKESEKEQPGADTRSAEDDADDDELQAAEAKKQKVRMAQFVLSSALPESPGEVGPFGDLQVDLRKTLDRLDKAADDDSISGVVLELRNPAIGRGKLNELRDAIKQFRQSGKKVYAQIEVGTPADYLIACACDEIVMPESGFLIVPGVHAEAMFYKGLLKNLGIKADFMHMGDYKGAAEPFTRKKHSPAVHENLSSVIDDLYDQMVATIADDRPLSMKEVRELIDVGLITARRAHEAGLIDRLAYPDALREDLARSLDAEPLVYVRNYGKQDVDTDFSGPMGIVKLLQLMMGAEPGQKINRQPKIAVVYAIGPIMSGESEHSPFGGQMMGSTTIAEALREADEDDKVKAIVLRINSPGGSAVASDLIWRETQRIKKPIVASMGDVAASGGYYIAMGADKIYAEPGTITGSIGVVSGKMAFQGTYRLLGITTDTIQRGQNSGMFGGSGKFSKTERTAMRGLMEEIYDQFTRKAAEGRGMSHEELLELAGGRIYTGKQARQRGLVDQVGTLRDAVDAAKKLAGLNQDDEVQIKLLPEPKNFFETMFGDLDEEKEVRLSLGLEQVAPELAAPLRRAHQLQRIFREPAAVIMPFELEIR